MARYLVWFTNNRAHTELSVRANSRTHAIEIFAAHHGVRVSAYIAARIVKE